MSGKAVVPGLIDENVSNGDDLVQALQIEVLPDFLETEDGVVGGADPFSGVDNTALGGGDDVRTRHSHGLHTQFLEGKGGHAGRRAELDLADLVKSLVALLEPAEGLGAHGHAEVGLDVHLDDLLIVLVEELMAVTFEVPGHHGVLVEAHAEAGSGGGEENAGGMLAGPVVGPGLAAVDEALVHGIEDAAGLNDSAFGEDFNSDLALRELFDTVAEAFEHLGVDAGAALSGLDLQFILSGHGVGAKAQYGGGCRDSCKLFHKNSLRK